MSMCSKIYHFRYLLAVLFVLPLVCACSSSDDAGEVGPMPQIATSDHYINLQIMVSSGSENAMRAPQGGEDGDGREEGSERENQVTGITLMLYQTTDGKGINTTNIDATLAFVKYYPVAKVDKTLEKTEVAYSTGDQSLENSGIDLTKTYHAIIVANRNLTGIFTKGVSTVGEVRDYCSTTIYNGSSVGATAEEFVMSLERDYSFTFSNPTVNGNKVTYVFDNIYIERLAARVDFWMKGATYQNSSDKTPGYEYAVANSSDQFVLTAITPFNLYKGDEYLFKRIGDGTTTDYLANETAGMTNYVLDPNTLSKTSSPTSCPDFMEANYWLDNLRNEDLRMTMSSVQDNTQWGEAKGIYTENSETADNIIVCYPKENTLLKETPLYYYATGLCIEGDYYKDGETEPTHYTYYGFLRHEGEGAGSYKIMTKEDLDKTKVSQFPMNFGVVRNNIYRISIDEITEKRTEDPKITLRIVVKNWDEFKHDTIYM